MSRVRLVDSCSVIFVVGKQEQLGVRNDPRQDRMLVTRDQTRFGEKYDERWQKRHECAVCHTSVVERWNGESWEIVCGENHDHDGFSRIKSMYELWKEDPHQVPIYIRNTLERKYRRKT